MSLEEADALINSLASRDLPDIWEVAGRKRVLRTDLDFKDKTLLLLYSDIESAILAEDLFAWSRYSNFTAYKKKVLGQLDSENLIDYDAVTDSVTLSPLGSKVVEERVLAHPLKPTSSSRSAKRPRKKTAA